MILYGRKTSINVQKILWFLHELNQPYEHKELGGKFGGLDTPEFSSLNPTKKVPVLLVGKTPIWESHSILRYLAASYGDDAWYSNEPLRRSQYERWMDWSLATFQPAFMGVFIQRYRLPPEKRNAQVEQQFITDCQQCLRQLDSALGNSDFLLGSDISLADICAGVLLYRLFNLELDIAPPEHVLNWYQRLQKREGYQKWVMTDFSDLKFK